MLAHQNINPDPFVWTKRPHDILRKIIRANDRLSFKENETQHWPVSLMPSSLCQSFIGLVRLKVFVSDSFFREGLARFSRGVFLLNMETVKKIKEKYFVPIYSVTAKAIDELP